MAFSKQSTFGLCCILLFHSAIVLSLDSDCRHQEEKLAQLKAKFRAYQRTAFVALKRHSAQQYEQRSPCPRSDNYRTTQKNELEQTTASGVESLRNERNFQSLLDGKLPKLLPTTFGLLLNVLAYLPCFSCDQPAKFKAISSRASVTCWGKVECLAAIFLWLSRARLEPLPLAPEH